MCYLTDLLNMNIGDEINLTETKRLTRVLVDGYVIVSV